MQRYSMLSLLSLSAAVLLCVGNAAAQAPKKPPPAATAALTGTYASTTTQVCLSATGGFNASLQAIGTANTSTNTIEGIRTFDGDGNGTITQRGVSLDLPPTLGFLPSASSSESTGSFTYTVAGDTFAITVVGELNGKVLTGPRAGQTFTLAGIPTLPGFIALGGRTLNASDEAPGVEIERYSDGTVIKRICHRSVTFIKVSP
jgi:hypothetical protein